MKTTIGRRQAIRTAAGAGIAASLPRTTRAAGTVQMISHRYPALELWAAKMKTAVPGVEVNTQLVPFDKALELSTIALSAKSYTLDIVYASEAPIEPDPYPQIAFPGWSVDWTKDGVTRGAEVQIDGDRSEERV